MRGKSRSWLSLAVEKLVPGPFLRKCKREVWNCDCSGRFLQVDVRTEAFPWGCSKGCLTGDHSVLPHSAFMNSWMLWLSAAVGASIWNPSWKTSQACCLTRWVLGAGCILALLFLSFCGVIVSPAQDTTSTRRRGYSHGDLNCTHLGFPGTRKGLGSGHRVDILREVNWIHSVRFSGWRLLLLPLHWWRAQCSHHSIMAVGSGRPSLEKKEENWIFSKKVLPSIYSICWPLSSFLWSCVCGSWILFSHCPYGQVPHFSWLYNSVSPSMSRAPGFSVLLGLMALVSPQLNKTVEPSDFESSESHTLTLKTFLLLSKSAFS